MTDSCLPVRAGFPVCQADPPLAEVAANPRLLTPPLLTGPVCLQHRRRIKTEGKAKVVAGVGGEEFIQFLATQAVLPRTILNNTLLENPAENN